MSIDEGFCDNCSQSIERCGDLKKFIFHENDYEDRYYCLSNECFSKNLDKQTKRIEFRPNMGEPIEEIVKPEYINLYIINNYNTSNITNNNDITNNIDNSNITNNTYYVQPKPEEPKINIEKIIEKTVRKIHKQYKEDLRDEIRLKQQEEELEKEKKEQSKLLKKDLEKRQEFIYENEKKQRAAEYRANYLFTDRKIPDYLKMKEIY